MNAPAPGRRIAAVAATRRPGPALLTGIGSVVLSAVALAATAPATPPAEVAPTPPATERLVERTLSCPGPAGEDTTLRVLSGARGEGDGSAALRVAGTRRERTVRLRPGRLAEASADGPTVLQGTGALAPGLTAARVARGARPAWGECPAPSAERWYAGVGAGGEHASRLVLVNPDPRPAVADVTAWSTAGAPEQIESRGLTVPGRGRSVLDLEELAPHREALVLRVRTVRGRLGGMVEHGFAQGTDRRVADWVPETAAPATDQLLPGLPRDADEQVLVLANPGETEGRVAVRVVGSESTFAPADLPEVRVPAGRTVVTDLTDVLGEQLRGDDAALLVTGTVPVVAGLRVVVGDDPGHLAATLPAPGRHAALAPPGGRRTLVLAGAEVAGRVTITFPGSPGRERRRIRPDVALAVPVPAEARAVVVASDVGYTGAVRSVTDRGVAVAPLRPLVTEELVPQVRPAWP